MKRIAFLSLLLVPSVVGAQHSAAANPVAAPAAQDAVDGSAVDPAIAQYTQRPVLSQTVDPRLAVSPRTVETSTAGWFGDVGFYVLRPQWSGGNPAFATTIAEGDTTDFSQTEFDHDYSFAPLVSIGYAGRNGLGVRARWWTLRSRDHVAGAFAGDPDFDVDFTVPSLLGTGALIPGFAGVDDDQNLMGVAGDFRNRLSLDVIDLESIWDTAVGRNSLLFSAGVRYAHIGQSFDAEVDQTIGLLTESGTMSANQTFNGAGPTASLQAFRMIGQTNLSVYGISRGSLLFGEARQRARSTVELEFPPNGAGPIIISETHSGSLNYNSVRPVMELEVGTNWTRSLGAFDLFAESGLVGMVWFNAGNAANSDALTAGNIGTHNANQNLGLVGLRFSTGVRF